MTMPPSGSRSCVSGTAIDIYISSFLPPFFPANFLPPSIVCVSFAHIVSRAVRSRTTIVSTPCIRPGRHRLRRPSCRGRLILQAERPRAGHGCRGRPCPVFHHGAGFPILIIYFPAGTDVPVAAPSVGARVRRGGPGRLGFFFRGFNQERGIETELAGLVFCLLFLAVPGTRRGR